MSKKVSSKLPPHMTELSAYIDKDLKLQFKLACTAIERPMSDVIEELIKDWLAKQKKGNLNT